MCLEATGSGADIDRVISAEPIFKKSCQVCGRPALTLDDAGDPVCPRHAKAFIGSESTYGTIRYEDLDEEG
jgi:hypothetical protein